MSDEQEQTPEPKPEIPQQLDITSPRPTDKPAFNSSYVPVRDRETNTEEDDERSK
jgi:hypothetical protein